MPKQFSVRWRCAYAAAIVAISRRVLSLGAGNSFFYDEWQFVTERRSLTTAALFVPHNGHLSAVPAAVFMLLLRIAGLSHYGAFRLAVLAVHMVVALLAAILVRRRFGELWGLCALVVVGLMGAGWQNVFWGLQFGYVASIACMLGVLLVLDDDARVPSRRRAAMASVLVAVSLLSSGVGVPVLVAVASLCLAGRRRRELWWVPVAPAVMYGLWYLKYGKSSVDWSATSDMLEYSCRSVSAAMGGVFGFGERMGQVLAGASIVMLAAHLARRNATIRSSTPLVFYAVFLALLAVSRSSSPEPDSSRYLYVGIVAMIATVACAGGPSSPTRSRSRIGVLALSAAAVWGSNATLEYGAHWLRNQGDIVGAELAVVEAHRDSLDPTDVVDPVHAPALSVGKYLAAVDGLGSSAAVPFSSIPTMGLSARTGQTSS